MYFCSQLMDILIIVPREKAKAPRGGIINHRFGGPT